MFGHGATTHLSADPERAVAVLHECPEVLVVERADGSAVGGSADDRAC